MDYYGFIYLWFDRKRKKFCVGSHKGHIDDGYITRTGYMSKAYIKRPNDFKRRILAYCYIQVDKELRLLEERWLEMIKPEELGKRYYNFKRRAAGGNLYEGLSATKLAETKIKLSEARTGAKHWAASAVWCEGTRYETKIAAHKSLGFDPTSRIKSISIKNINWYFEKNGPKNAQECIDADIARQYNQRAHLEKITQINKNLPQEYHKIRTNKSRETSLVRGSYKVMAEKISKLLTGRPHKPVQIANEFFPSFAMAAKQFNVTSKTIRDRVRNLNFPDYKEISINEYKSRSGSTL